MILRGGKIIQFVEINLVYHNVQYIMLTLSNFGIETVSTHKTKLIYNVQYIYA